MFWFLDQRWQNPDVACWCVSLWAMEPDLQGIQDKVCNDHLMSLLHVEALCNRDVHYQEVVYSQILGVWKDLVYNSEKKKYLWSLLSFFCSCEINECNKCFQYCKLLLGYQPFSWQTTKQNFQNNCVCVLFIVFFCLFTLNYLLLLC